MNKIKESKNIFPCTLRVKAIPEEDYDIFNLYADGYWYTYDDGDETDEPTIINNEDELKDAVDEYFDNPEMSADGDQVLIRQNDLVRNILNTGKGKIFVYDYDQVDRDKDGWEVDDWRERLVKKEPNAVLIMTANPTQNNIEPILAESFEKIIKDLQKEGLFENIKSFDLSLSRKGISIKLNESLSEDTLKEASKTPFTDLIMDVIEDDDWLSEGEWYKLQFTDTGAFYDEISDNTGVDYDDVKEDCWDMVPEVDANDIREELIKEGSEKYLFEKYGSLNNLKKALKDDLLFDKDGNSYNPREDTLVDFQWNFKLEDWQNQLWREAVMDATSYIESKYNDNDDDDDDWDDDDD